ncbi:MAG: hypothetical protein GC159_23645 [Phycisphaera sp.]|nr:hypothetical protein [Phycisphaera sp.]
MSNDYTKNDDWRVLVDRLIDETLDDADWPRLRDRLANDAEARAYYQRRVALHTALVWEAVPIAQELNRRESACDVDVCLPETSHVIERVGTPRRMIAMRIAAVLVLFVGVGAMIVSSMPKPEPKRQSAPAPAPIAVLSDLTNAKWEVGPEGSPVIGADMDASDLHLLAGRVQFVFASGAVVNIQGPADFSLTSRNGCRLQRGRLVTYVPEKAHGFTVVSPGLTVVDLGTQFGIEVNDGVPSEVHVFRGQVEAQVIGGSGKVVQQSRLSQGHAVRLDRSGEPTLAEVAIDTKRFLDVEPALHTFRLLDAMAEGRGPDKPGGISMIDGTPTNTHADGISGNSNFFVTVPHNPYIDGVFIPDGVADGQPVPVQIASTGLVAHGLPDTCGVSFDNLWLGVNRTVFELPNGLSVDKPGHAVLGMHANKGLTIDLDAVRRARPGMHIERFKSVIGNARGSVEFFVLLDGQIMYSSGLHAGSPNGMSVDVPIDANQRFLTLIVTDGDGDMAFDWAVLIDPVLELLGH